MKKLILSALFLAITSQCCSAAGTGKWVWSPAASAPVFGTATWTPSSTGLGTPTYSGRSGTYWNPSIATHASASISTTIASGNVGSVSSLATATHSRRYYWVSPKSLCTICPSPPTYIPLTKNPAAEWNLAAASGAGMGNSASVSFNGTAILTAGDDYGVTSHTGTTVWGTSAAGATTTESAAPGTIGDEAPNIGSRSATMSVNPDVKCTVVYQVEYSAKVVASAASSLPGPGGVTYFAPQSHGVAQVHGPGI